MKSVTCDVLKLDISKYSKEVQPENIDRIFLTCDVIKFDCLFINPLASPCAGAPALKYGDVNTETTSPGEVKGLIVIKSL